mmetsp:Transcript_102534/g.293565  ORF Transcript_102534/g.293565 Transcript_102534/m.293565 type:complete len:227 (+) Transcript_102534:2187-2867(+)
MIGSGWTGARRLTKQLGTIIPIHQATPTRMHIQPTRTSGTPLTTLQALPVDARRSCETHRPPPLRRSRPSQPQAQPRRRSLAHRRSATTASNFTGATATGSARNGTARAAAREHARFSARRCSASRTRVSKTTCSVWQRIRYGSDYRYLIMTNGCGMWKAASRHSYFGATVSRRTPQHILILTSILTGLGRTPHTTTKKRSARARRSLPRSRRPSHQRKGVRRAPF